MSSGICCSAAWRSRCAVSRSSTASWDWRRHYRRCSSHGRTLQRLRPRSAVRGERRFHARHAATRCCCAAPLIGASTLAGPGGMPRSRQRRAVLARHVAAIVGTALERLFRPRPAAADGHQRFRGRLAHRATTSGRGCAKRSRARSAAGTALTCAVVDVDAIGVVNERYGISPAMRRCARWPSACRSQLRVSDATAHLGSDEFVMLLPDTAVGKGILLAERMLGAVHCGPIVLGAGHRAADDRLDRSRRSAGVDRVSSAKPPRTTCSRGPTPQCTMRSSREATLAIAGDDASARAARHQQQEYRHADQRGQRTDGQLPWREHDARGQVRRHQQDATQQRRPRQQTRWSFRAPRRTRCGVTRPTKPMLPAVLTAQPVIRELNTKTTLRSARTSRPTVAASSSPRASTLSGDRAPCRAR